jgi:hypothetical protein
MNDKSNIPSELQNSPTENLKVSPQDPETAKAVNEFLQQKSAESGGIPMPEGTQSPIEEKPTEVAPNPEFEAVSPQDAVISDALATNQDIPISDIEREVFIKCVLNDSPVRLTVELYGGKLKIELRSRTTFEQKRVFDVLDLDRKENIVTPDNVAEMVSRMQYYMAALMVERINGELFSELKLEPGTGQASDHAKLLRAQVSNTIEKMTGVRWNSILNALRMFENKCAKMNTEALNEGFWKPRGSA